VSNEGTGYDLLHAILPHADEFVVPLSVALRLRPKPSARKTLTYGYDDPAKAAAALDKLGGSPRSPIWVHVSDGAAAPSLLPGVPSETVTVQVAVAGSVAGLAAREKGIDGVLAGFKAKASDVPNPFDVPAEVYRKTSDRIGRSLFVGEIRVPARSFAELLAKLRALGQKSAAPASLYASLRKSGIVSAFPAFESLKERHRIYELSRGVLEIAHSIPGATFGSRLAHLWETDPNVRRRFELLRRLKLEIDAPRVIQPLVRA